MSDKDEVLALLDDLLRLAEGSGATAISRSQSFTGTT